MMLPAVVQHYLDAYNRKDAAALVACVDDAVVFENVSNAGQSIRIEGRAAFAELAERATTLFATRHQAVRTTVVQDDRVALEIDWTGIPAIDLGQLKAGEPIAMRGSSFLTIADGKLTRIVDIS